MDLAGGSQFRSRSWSRSITWQPPPAPKIAAPGVGCDGSVGGQQQRTCSSSNSAPIVAEKARIQFHEWLPGRDCVACVEGTPESLSRYRAGHARTHAGAGARDRSPMVPRSMLLPLTAPSIPSKTHCEHRPKAGSLNITAGLASAAVITSCPRRTQTTKGDEPMTTEIPATLISGAGRLTASVALVFAMTAVAPVASSTVGRFGGRFPGVALVADREFLRCRRGFA